VLQLQHRRDLGKAVQPLDERIDAGLAEAAREGELLLRRDALVAEEDHQVLQQRPAHLRHGLVVHGLRQVQAEDLRPDAAGQRLHLDALVAGIAGRLDAHLRHAAAAPLP
jgi:hypothetical protein